MASNDVTVALGPGGVDDYKKLKLNASDELITALPTGIATESSLEFGNVFFGTTIRYASLTQASTTDTWTFKTAAAGTTVAVIVITYTDSTKATISNIERTT